MPRAGRHERLFPIADASFGPYGRIYGTEIGRGFDVMNPSGALDSGSTRLNYLNAQTQQPLSR